MTPEPPSTFEPPREEHPFAPYVRILGKGKSGSRSLNPEEARTAFGMLLRGEVESLQMGAFLMLLRVKEETGEELAGFVQACRDEMIAPPPELTAALDWSSYAGKRGQHPWFLLSALLLAENGCRVFIHGSDGHTAGRLYTEQAMRSLGLPVGEHWEDTSVQLDRDGISYLPLRCFCAPLHEMMQLRHLLGLRSPVNTLARMLNPLRAECSIQSVFHPAYGVLHQDADILLQQPRSLVFKGESGEVEVKPVANTRLQQQVVGERLESTLPRAFSGRGDRVATPTVAPVRALWRDEVKDVYGLEATLATAAVALSLLQNTELGEARALVEDWWARRNRRRIC